MELALPLIGQYSAITQVIILVLLFIPSSLYSQFRKGLLATIGLYIGVKVFVPLGSWILAAFKAVALCGFYIHFFIQALNYGSKGFEYLMHGVDLIASETLKDRMRMEREAEVRQQEQNSNGGRRRSMDDLPAYEDAYESMDQHSPSSPKTAKKKKRNSRI